MFGARVFLSRTGLAARRPKAGGDSASGTDLADPPIAVSPARGGVAARLAPGVEDRARPAQRLALERGGGASHAQPHRAPGIVGRLVGRAPRDEAILAAGPAVHGGLPGAADAHLRVTASSPAPAAAPTPLQPSRGDVFATVFQAGLGGLAVPGTFGRPAPPGAGGAQLPARLVRGSTALAAELARQPILGPLPGAAVLGLAELRIPDPLDAGGAASLGAPGIGRAALLPANLARPTALHGRLPAASDAQTGRLAGGNAPTVALAVRRAAGVGVTVRHGTVSTGVMSAAPLTGRRNGWSRRVSDAACAAGRSNMPRRPRAAARYGYPAPCKRSPR